MTILPIGYVTILQAAETLQASMFAGVPDRDAVIELRKEGMSVKDGLATDQAIAEIWKAVDAEWVQALAVGGGHPPRTVKLNPAITKQIRTYWWCNPPRTGRLIVWIGSWLCENAAMRRTDRMVGCLRACVLGMMFPRDGN